MKIIRLREGRERSLLRGHPWVFDSAIERGSAGAGELVRVAAQDGRFLAWGAFSPASRIRVRIWSLRESERIDPAFIRARIAAAIQARRWFDIVSDGMRLVHGEADGLPGLVVDRYGDTLVAQFGAVGVEHFKSVIADALLAETGLTRLYERSDATSRAREGLPPVAGWLRGAGDTRLTIREHGWRLALDIAGGHKTGFYLDQRDNRALLAAHAARRGFRRVLNCHCYSGGFTVAALMGLKTTGSAGEVISVDSSAAALELARENLALNDLDAGATPLRDADVNATLRELLAAGERFDAIVLDPPKLAPTVTHAQRAARAYKDINRLALQLLAPGGELFTFSCSGGVSAGLFHKIVAAAGADAGVDGFVAARLSAAPDHPMTLVFPEGEYLKGLVVVRKA